MDFTSEVCIRCEAGAAKDSRIKTCPAPKPGRGGFIFKQVVSSIKRDAALSTTNPDRVAIPSHQVLLDELLKFKVNSPEDEENGVERYRCPITAATYASNDKNPLLRPSNDACFLVGLEEPGKARRILHNFGNVQVIPRALNYGKGVYSTDSVGKVLKCMVIQKRIGTTVTRLPTTPQGDVPPTPVGLFFDEMAMGIRANTKVERKIAYRCAGRLDNTINPASFIESVNNDIYARTDKDLLPPNVRAHQERFKKPYRPTRATKKKATGKKRKKESDHESEDSSEDGSENSDSPAATTPIANSVVIPELDDLILGPLERKYGKYLRRTADGVRTPFNAPGERKMTSRTLEVIFKARKQVLMTKCNR